jgi:hypothetical protein
VRVVRAVDGSEAHPRRRICRGGEKGREVAAGQPVLLESSIASGAQHAPEPAVEQRRDEGEQTGWMVGADVSSSSGS